MCVVKPGEAPQKITWWFAKPGAPHIERHQFHPLTWVAPLDPQGPVGEVSGAARPWSNGLAPQGACGAVRTGCQDSDVIGSQTALARMPAGDVTWPLLYDPPSDSWQGTVETGDANVPSIDLSVGCRFVTDLETHVWEAEAFIDVIGDPTIVETQRGSQVESTQPDTLTYRFIFTKIIGLDPRFPDGLFIYVSFKTAVPPP